MIIDFISRLGFPIAVATWMLYRDWRRMGELTSTVRELTTAIETLTALLTHPRAPRG